MELKFEQSDKECCTDTAGLYFVGKPINKNASLRQELKKIKKQHGIIKKPGAKNCGVKVWGQIFICASVVIIDDILYTKRKT